MLPPNGDGPTTPITVETHEKFECQLPEPGAEAGMYRLSPLKSELYAGPYSLLLPKLPILDGGSPPLPPAKTYT